MEQLPNCPECGSEYTYEDGELLVCPECAHEWSKNAVEEGSFTIRDANGTVLQDGDSVTVIKDLKIKGSSSVVKVGRLLDKPDHNIDCKIPGIGAMAITAAFVKKA